MSPVHLGGISPTFSSRSLEDLSPIRPADVHKSRSDQIHHGINKMLLLEYELYAKLFQLFFYRKIFSFEKTVFLIQKSRLVLLKAMKMFS